MDSAQSLQRRGGLVSLSPSQTPRSSDKSARDLRSADSNSSTKYDKDKGVNVQVIVRCRSVYSKFPCFGFWVCFLSPLWLTKWTILVIGAANSGICFCRPLNDDELRIHTPVVVSCHDGRREVCAIQNIANKQIDRTFMFDKVCINP